MKILAIPGKMPATKTWLADILEHAHLSDAQILLHEFDAWKTSTSFDVNNECRQLPMGHFDLVITKSIGTLLVLRSHNLTWNKLIFIGSALSLYETSDKQALVALKDKYFSTLMIQEDQDPFGGYDELNALLGEDKGKVTCFSVKGEHHQYPNTTEIGQMITHWLHDEQ